MKIALIQSALVWGKVDENLDRFAEKIAALPEGDVVILPEMFTSGCMMVKKAKEEAEAEKKSLAARYEEVRERMRGWAVDKNALILGSAVCEENGRYYNRLLAAFPDGHCLYYDKRHCFRMGGEQEHFSAGHRLLVFDYRGVRMAVFICYDLRFPVWSRNTSGYELAVYVANWPESRRDVWNTLLRARAIENQAYVAGVNCVGADNNGLMYSGDSALIDPKGHTVAACRSGVEETVIAEPDFEQLRLFRQKFPVLDDRDVFRVLGEED